MNDQAQPHTAAEIRRLLTTAFDDVGLISLCQDEFPQLCDRLGRGLRKDEIINMIMDHFRRCGDYAPLLAAVKEREPKPYPPRTGPPMPAFRKLLAVALLTIAVALLAAIGLGSTLGWSVVERWVGRGVFDRPTPTARAEPLADVHVRFTVTLSTGEQLEIPAGGTLPLTPGDRILIGVNVTIDQLPFPRDLTYQYFAPQGNIPEELTGPDVSYAGPEKPGQDIITVRIRDQETGEEIVRSINVEAKEQPP